MTEKVTEAVAKREGFAGEVGGAVGITGGAIVAEVADFEDVGVDAAGFAVPAGSGIVEGHCVNGHAEIIDGESGEGLPFSHQAHLGDALFDQGSVDGIAKCPEKARPVADLPNPDTAAEEMLEDVDEDKDRILCFAREKNFSASVIPCPKTMAAEHFLLYLIDLFIRVPREVAVKSPVQLNDPRIDRHSEMHSRDIFFIYRRSPGSEKSFGFRIILCIKQQVNIPS